jgi:hypothetical protein
VEKTGKKRPWKSLRDFHFSHSFNNNKLDDRDHFQQNAKTSVASLRGLIGSSRNIDRDHSGILIDFIGIPIWGGFTPMVSIVFTHDGYPGGFDALGVIFVIFSLFSAY